MSATRCDLHLHSAASIGNDEWYTRFFGCPESYAEPIQQYELCKARGMSLVTLTDHDTIAGGLQLIGRSDFFLSEEITALFPENGCIMHVLAWNITQAQHEGIQDRRQDIYRLCEYLDGAGIAHGLAHPLLSPNWKLDREIVEKVLLLFPALEGVNGLTDRRIEPDLAVLLDRLTPDVIAALAAKHGFAPHGRTPHKKALTAGSDDHVRRRSGTVFTEVDGALAPPAFIARCMAGEGRLVGRQAHIDAMAMSVKHTTYHHLKQRQDENAGYRNPFVDMIDLIAGRDPETATGQDSRRKSLVPARRTAARRAASWRACSPAPRVPRSRRASPTTCSRCRSTRQRKTMPVSSAPWAASRTGSSSARSAICSRPRRSSTCTGSSAPPATSRAGSSRPRPCSSRPITSASRSRPCAACGASGRRSSCRRARSASPSSRTRSPRRAAPRAGATRFLSRARAEGREVLVPYCGELPAHVADRGAFHAVPALTSFTLPIPSGPTFHVPSLVETLQWTWREGVSHVELATPGPMGLVGLLAAKVLRLPVTASYHTEVPALVQPLGGNQMMERAARRYLAWFYARVDRVFAFSTAARASLAQMGVAEEKIAVMPEARDELRPGPLERWNEASFSRIWSSLTQQT